MADTLQTVTNIKEVLGIAGLSLVLLSVIIRTVIKAKTEDTKNNEFYLSVINKGFIIAVIALLLSFAGWGYEKYLINRSPKKDNSITLKANVYNLGGKPLELVAVSATNTTQGQKYTDVNGAFELSIADTSETKTLHLIFKKNEPKIDCVMDVRIDTFPREFRLGNKPPGPGPGIVDPEIPPLPKSFHFTSELEGLEESIGLLKNKLRAGGYTDHAASSKKISIKFSPADVIHSGDYYYISGNLMISVGNNTRSIPLNSGQGFSTKETAENTRRSRANQLLKDHINEVYNNLRTSL